MKNRLGVIIAISMVLGTVNVHAAERIYPIANYEDLFFAAQHPELSYELTDNIEWDKYAAQYSIGTDDKPFTGTFDGNGYKIRCRDSLFGTIGKSGVVENLIIDHDTFEKTEKSEYVLAEKNNGLIRQCYTYGETNTESPNSSGFVQLNTGVIENCVSNVNAEVAFASDNDGDIKNCYTPRKLDIADTYENVEGCYSNLEKSGVYLSADDMKNESLYTGWDFENIWTTCGGRIEPVPVSMIGRGTESEPFRIYDIKTLAAIGCGEYSRGKYYKQAGEIEKTYLVENGEICGYYNGKTNSRYYYDQSYKPDYYRIKGLPMTAGTEEEPFEGHYDGDNKLVYSWLFGVVGSDGYICNMNAYVVYNYGENIGGIACKNYGTIKNSYAKLSFKRTDGKKENIGGIAGVNSGIIEDCRSNIAGSVYNSTISLGIGIGGIAGYNDRGIIRRCTSNGSIQDGERAVGGIAGDNSGGMIEDCKAKMTLARGKEEIGGIAGRLYGGTIKTCYANCWIHGISLMGGIAGTIIDDGQIIDSYFVDVSRDGAVSGSGNDSVITNVIKSDDVNHIMTFTGFDFANTWYMDGRGPELISVIGDGTEQNPYIIRNESDWFEKGKRSLKSTGSRLSYVIMNDLTKSETDYCIGDEDDPFIGHVEGNGYSVDEIIDTLGAEGYLTNLRFTSAISVAVNKGTIENCIGGVRTNDGGKIMYCLNDGFVAVNNKNNGLISYSCRIDTNGGIVQNNSASVEKCYTEENTDDTELLWTILTGKEEDAFLIERNYLSGKFKDIEGHWAEETITYMYENGVIDGYSDNTFRPDNTVTKGEFLKLMFEAVGKGTSDISSVFEDANKSWAAGYVNQAYVLGITSHINKSAAEFGVDDTITRTEAAVLIGRLLKPSGGHADFTDNESIPEWARSAVGAAVEEGIITGMDDGSFAPNEKLTRAQAAVIVSRLQK